LIEIDLTESDLTSAVFDNCDLKATFDHTILEKADLRNSYNCTFDPENNRIKKAKFSLEGLAGLLGKYDIEVE
jgi:fluoroquinolone resistance protein